MGGMKNTTTETKDAAYDRLTSANRAVDAAERVLLADALILASCGEDAGRTAVVFDMLRESATRLTAALADRNAAISAASAAFATVEVAS